MRVLVFVFVMGRLVVCSFMEGRIWREGGKEGWRVWERRGEGKGGDSVRVGEEGEREKGEGERERLFCVGRWVWERSSRRMAVISQCHGKCVGGAI